MNFRTVFATALMLFGLVGAALAGPVNVNGDGVALEGHDPVAYFTQGRPVKGETAYVTVHDGATYQFASAENKSMFDSDPAKYLPQYGGFCAYGMASGYQAPVEIDRFTVVDGKLYLNYNGSVQTRWRKDIDGYVAKADQNWKTQ
jgi:YHS domain-containing protein